jgi:hypothetical protein
MVFEVQAQEHYKTATFSELETIMEMVKALCRSVKTYIDENELNLPDLAFHLQELQLQLEDYYGSQ